MKYVSAAVAGFLFGLGLIVSGMTQPAKVQGFLDVAGAWDPSLAFVMVGAISVAAVGFALERRRRSPPSPGLVHVSDPPKRIDHRLVLGSLIFGAGWGLAGYCPGPALVSLGAGLGQAAIFVAAMVAGMGLYELFKRD